MQAKDFEFGQLIHTRYFLDRDTDANFDELWEQAAAAEAAGLDHVWLGDSIAVPNKGRGDCLTSMAALAMCTRTIRIGTVPLLASLRNPVLLAQALATLDVIAKGRLLIGVSPGPVADDIRLQFEACGVPASEKAGRLDETLSILRALWAEHRIDFAGRYFRLNETGILPRPLQKPGVPIFVAADRSDIGFRRVARHGDGWITAICSVEEFAAARRKIEVFASAEEREGAALPSMLYATFNLDTDGARARETGWAWMEDFYDQPRGKLDHHCTIFGTPEECADLVRRYRDAGLSGVIARFASTEIERQRNLFAFAFKSHVLA